ncbi:unnamed protein product, partial [Ixodes persulcatus]
GLPADKSEREESEKIDRATSRSDVPAPCLTLRGNVLGERVLPLWKPRICCRCYEKRYHNKKKKNKNIYRESITAIFQTSFPAPLLPWCVTEKSVSSVVGLTPGLWQHLALKQ